MIREDDIAARKALRNVIREAAKAWRDDKESPETMFTAIARGVLAAGYRQALSPEGGWRDIKDAPHGVDLLVFVPMADHPTNLPKGSYRLAYKTDPAPPLMQTWRFSSGPGRGQQCGWPSHFRPLPSPPSGDGATTPKP